MSTAASVTVPRNYIQAGHISIGVTATSYDLKSLTANSRSSLCYCGNVEDAEGFVSNIQDFQMCPFLVIQYI